MNKLLFVLFFTWAIMLQSQTDTILKNDSAKAQQKKDSLNRKHRFIGINIAGGLAWRGYLHHSKDSEIKYGEVPQTGEMPGSAYSFAFNSGHTIKRWTHTFGIEYDFAKYYNYSYAYSYIHYFLSLSYSFNYQLDKANKWRVGANFELGRLLEYTRKRYDQPTKQFFPWGPTANSILHIEKNITAWSGVFIGNKLLETKKLRLFVDLLVNVSSMVGYKTLQRQYYAPGLCYSCAPTAQNYYESKPHVLLVPALRFNLQYKL